MQHKRACLGAAVLNDTIHVGGGQAGRTIHASMEAYDPGIDNWIPFTAHMQVARKYAPMAAHQGRLYIFGGMSDRRSRLSSVEAYDPREGKWSGVPSMSVSRSSAGVVVLQDRIYLAGGNSSDDVVHASMEMFVPAAGKWMECAALSQPRSGMAMFPV
jgi:N-acetylneuraminic acid mutarotase